MSDEAAIKELIEAASESLPFLPENDDEWQARLRAALNRMDNN